jgi:hypothetical protein
MVVATATPSDGGRVYDVVTDGGGHRHAKKERGAEMSHRTKGKRHTRRHGSRGDDGGHHVTAVVKAIQEVKEHRHTN